MSLEIKKWGKRFVRKLDSDPVHSETLSKAVSKGDEEKLNTEGGGGNRTAVATVTVLGKGGSPDILQLGARKSQKRCVQKEVQLRVK